MLTKGAKVDLFSTHQLWAPSVNICVIPEYTKILEVNLFAFAHRLFHEDFSPIYGALHDTQPFSSYIYIKLVAFLNV